MSDRQVRVLLAGGIGAGKSSVGDLLRARGALVIDADEVGHQVLEPGGEAFDRVSATWPSVVVDGVIERRRLADIVFRSPAELQRLESFTHMAIRSRIADQIQASQPLIVVVEVPLTTDFMGQGWVRVVVDADRNGRMERLRRRGVLEEDMTRRMNAQPSRRRWLASADKVIDNSGSQEQLMTEVEKLWNELQVMAGS